MARHALPEPVTQLELFPAPRDADQHWSEGRSYYVMPSVPLRTRDYEVERLEGRKQAAAFLAAEHYLKRLGGMRFGYGMYRHGRLVGVAVFGPGSSNRTLTNVFGGTHRDSCELLRLAVHASVGFNGCSWLLARSFADLKAREPALRGVLSHSDPVMRTRLDGTILTCGHVGTCYQASNAALLARTKARLIRLLPDATTLSERTLQKIRSRDKGWRSGVRLLCSHGADEPRLGADLRDWLDFWLPRLTRLARHPGCFRYAWSFRPDERPLPANPWAYPKAKTALHAPRFIEEMLAA
jgi:hypothetical protein